VSFISRAAAFLLVAATAVVLPQTASAAELGLSVAVDEGGKINASVDIAAPKANASASASAAASVDQAAPSVSAAVETATAAVRVDVGRRPPTASEPAAPGRPGRMEPETRREGPSHADSRLHDRPVVAAASSGTAVPALEAPAALATRAAGTDTPFDVGLASLPERSAGGWGASVEAAATGISGSPLALAGLLLVAFSLFFRSLLGAVPAPRPSLHSFALQRPG
jgi:hypothetical protein